MMKVQYLGNQELLKLPKKAFLAASFNDTKYPDPDVTLRLPSRLGIGVDVFTHDEGSASARAPSGRRG